MIIVADITCAWPLTEKKFTAALQDRINRTGATRVVVVAYQRQKPHLLANSELRTVDDWTPRHELAALVAGQVVLPMLKSGQDNMEILSLNPAVLGITQDVPAFARARITSFHWFKIPQLDRVGPTPEPRGLVSEWSEGAIAAAVDTLRKFPDGVRKSSLRDILTGVSKEFEKRIGGPSISSLVTVLQRRSLIKISPQGHVNPHITLAIQSAPESSSVLDLPSEKQIPLAVPALRAQESQTVRSETACHSEGQDLPSGAKLPTRIQILFSHFKNAGLGPFSSDRADFYAELKRLVELKKYSANLIVKKAARNVMTQKKCTYPWAAGEKFLAGLLHRQPILLDQDGIKRDPTMVSSFQRPITHLAGGWEDLLDAELLFFLAQADDGSLGVDEMEMIGFIMFPALGDDERVERVEQLFGLLSSHGRIDTLNGKFVALQSIKGKTEATPFSTTVVQLVPQGLPDEPVVTAESRASTSTQDQSRNAVAVSSTTANA